MGVLTQTSAGSLGDQAMIDSISCHLVEYMGRRVVLGPNIHKTRSGAGIPAGDGRWDVMRNLAGMVLGCRSLGMIGADVIDGVYGAASVLKRLRILTLAHRLGQDVRVFGCSWSLKPSDPVVAVLKKADWLRLYARDPVSQARMQAALDRDIPLVADVAFLLRPEITSPEALAAARWIEGRRSASMTVMGVNLSGHTLEKAPDHGVAAFAGLVSRWLEADPQRAVLIVPHDRRPGMVGDLDVLKGLHAVLQARFPDRLHMLPATLDAWEVKGLAGKLDFVVTGRMHLAIAAMGMGVPALCTVYQDKFEGLMQHFGLEGTTISPEDVLAERCDDQLLRMTAHHADLGARIRERLPFVKDLSRKNFEQM